MAEAIAVEPAIEAARAESDVAEAPAAEPEAEVVALEPATATVPVGDVLPLVTADEKQTWLPPTPDLKADLWAAAAIVAKAAEATPISRPEPVSIVPVPTRAAQAAPAAAAQPEPPAPAPDAATPAGSPYNVPSHIAAARRSPDAVVWIMFGSAAAFLFIVWLAILVGFRW
jgi:ribonuclease E